MRIQELLNHEREVREAQAQYPGIDITEAYLRYKQNRGEKPEFISSADRHERDTAIARFTNKPCDTFACPGTKHLEPVCPSCVEGKAGFQSKWTCDTCFSRDLSPFEYSDWFDEYFLSESTQD